MTTPHPEQELQNAMTSPADRDATQPNALNRDTLTDDQLSAALQELNVKDNLVKFPRFDRLYADPSIPNQNICLHSFVPAKGASPDKDGVYGMIKIRGVFSTPEEANQRAEFLIKNNDSYHKIYHSWMGRPIPLSHNPQWVAESKEVDLNDKTSKVMTEDVKEKKHQEKKDMEDIKQREKNLLEDVKKAPEEVDPEEKYTTARVKKAQLIWTYLQSLKKIEEMKPLIIAARNLVTEMDEQHPDFQKTYFERYKKAREDSGVPMDDNSFIKYMVEDCDLGF
jgi:hypothetical protein